MPHRRDLLIAALLALATASGAWAERDRDRNHDRPLRDHYQQQRRDDRLQQPVPQRRMLPHGGFIQSDGFIHRDRRYSDNDDDRNRRDHQHRGNQNLDYQRRYDADDRDPPASGRPQRTVNDVIREVESRYGGKVVGVQTVQSAGGPAYRVRVLQRDGRVKTMVVPGH